MNAGVKWAPYIEIFFSRHENVAAAGNVTSCQLSSLIDHNCLPSNSMLRPTANWETNPPRHGQPGYHRKSRSSQILHLSNSTKLNTNAKTAMLSRLFLNFVQIFFQDCIVEDCVQLRLFHSICKLLESSLSPLKANGGLWTVKHSRTEIYFPQGISKDYIQFRIILPLCRSEVFKEMNRVCLFSERNPSQVTKHSLLCFQWNIQDLIFNNSKEKCKMVPRFSQFQKQDLRHKFWPWKYISCFFEIFW